MKLNINIAPNEGDPSLALRDDNGFVVRGEAVAIR